MVRFEDIKGKTIAIVDQVVAECGHVWQDSNITEDLRLRLGIEEIVENVVNYAYDSDESWIEAEIMPERTIIFRDGGLYFDPTKAAKYDINANLNDRKIGGLGIMIAGKYFDISYNRKNDINCLTMHYKL